MSEAFAVACDYALLQMQGELHSSPSENPDPHRYMEFHAQMVGAQRVLAILKTIHQPREDEIKPVTPTLNYQAGV